MFALLAFGVGAFTALTIDPSAWPLWLRLASSLGALGAWLWDVARHG